MWSDNKKVDYLINTLIFLVAINFMHYGQLFLPVICFILFIDNKFKFKVNNIKIFVVLCLFAISFCYFSYELGFYCVMGFTLPMAYYIGSNIKKNDEVAFKNIVLIIMFAMATHIILNFALDIYIRGVDFVNHQSRYDIWLMDKLTSTGIATNLDFMFSLIYFFIFREKNRRIKCLYIITLIILMIYEIFLGRRTQFFMIIICFMLSLLYDLIINKNHIINKKRIYWIIIAFVIFVCFFLYMYNENLLNIQDFTIIKKFRDYGLNLGRLEIFLDGIKYAPKYMFGGQIISGKIGNMFHDLLFDIYDYAGIIPFILMIIYIISFFISVYKAMIEKKINDDTKIIILELFIVIILQCAIEPIITGSSIFLICSIIIESSLERLIDD